MNSKELDYKVEYGPGASHRGPVLVTGMARSGTTWLGRMLTAGRQLTYVSEPLNLERPGVFGLGVAYWYPYLEPGRADPVEHRLRRAAQLRINLVDQARSATQPADILRVLKRGFLQNLGRWAGRPALLKDPYAVFSIPWFIDQLHCTPIVIVRHPLAVVGSMKRLGWSVPARNFLGQPALMERVLAPYESELRDLDSEHASELALNALLWKMIYGTVLSYRGSCTIVRHEDLSAAPVAEMAALYGLLHIPFTAKAKARIERWTGSQNPPELAHTHSIRLNSSANLARSRLRLDDAESQAVLDKIGHCLAHFYPREVDPLHGPGPQL